MINISLSELLPEAKKYQEAKLLFLGFLIGVIVMFISHIVL